MCERREKGAATFVSFARFVDIEFQNFTPVQKTCIVAETLAIPAYIATKAFLSFIGLGVQPPIPSWGNMIADGYGALRSAPHIIFFPALALSLAMLAFNVLGDAIRDAMDPKLRNR